MRWNASARLARNGIPALPARERRRRRPGLEMEGLERRIVLSSINPNAIATVGVYDENTVNTNTVDFVAAGSSVTNTQFAADMASAFAQNQGGVIDGSVLGTYYSYGTGQSKVLTVNSPTNWGIGQGPAISGTGSFSTINGSYSTFSLNFVSIDNGTPGEQVREIGITAMSFGEDYGNVTVTAKLASGRTESATRHINEATGRGDTFYGLAAPAGDAITGFTLHFDGSPGPYYNICFDDIGFITGPPSLAAMADSYQTPKNVALVVPAASGVLANDTDQVGSTPAATLATGPAHGSLTLNADGSFAYTPAANFLGIDRFTYRVNDGGFASSPANVTIDVTGPDDPPAAVNDAYDVNEGSFISPAAASGVLANDSDPNGQPLLAKLVSGPAHGSLTLNANGSFTYTPVAGFYGTDSFTYKANDGTLDSNVATVTLNVSNVNLTPVAVNDSYTATKNDALVVTAATGVLANDSDADGDPLSAVLVNGPSHGSLTLSADGSFRYTPNDAYLGTDSFTYRASDGTLTSAIATVTLNVTGPDDPPVAVDDAYSVTQDTRLAPSVSVLANDTDPNGQPVTAIVLTQPAHGGVSLTSAGYLVYTPNPGYTGTDSFTYKANDGTLDSNVATVTISVNPVVGWISGMLWNDANGNGLNDNGTEPKLSGRTVFLDQNQDGVLDNGEVSTTTAADGSYTFGNLPAGTYYVAEVLPAGWKQTSPGGAGTLPQPRVVTIGGAQPYLFDFNELASTTDQTIGPYHKSGFTFDTTVTQSTKFRVYGSSDQTHYAGSPALDTQWVPVTISLERDDRTAFSITSIDLSPNWTSVYSPQVTFTAIKADGTTVAQTIQLGNTLGFETFTLTGFTNIVSLMWPSSDPTNEAEFDNVNVQVAGPLNVPGINFGSQRQPPAAVADSYAVSKATALTVPAASGVLANDSDPAGLALKATLLGGPLHGSVTLNSDGSFTYTPRGLYLGNDNFTYRASDGVQSANATVTLSVTGPDDPPVASNDTYFVPGNSTGTLAYQGFSVLSNDSDPNGQALTAVLVSGPAHGTLSLAANGSFTYTPAANFYGADSFTYQASDGTLTSNAATATLKVYSVPQGVSESYATDENTPLKVAAPGVLANDTNASGVPFSVAPGASVSHGTLAMNADGSFTYTPATDFYGTDTLSYRVTDGAYYSNFVYDTITINHVNQLPVAVDDAYTAAYNGTLTTVVATSSIQGTSGSVFSYGPNDGTYSTYLIYGYGATVQFSPTANPGNIYSFTFAAPNRGRLVPGTYLNATRFPFEASGAPGFDINIGSYGPNTLTGQFTIYDAQYDAAGNLTALSADYKVYPDNATTAWVGHVQYRSGNGQPVGVLTNDRDPDNDPLTVALARGPVHGVVNLATDGSFSYTPDAGYSGPDSFTYTASDGQHSSNVATARIMVLGPPVVADDLYRDMVNGPCTIAAPGVLANDLDPQGSPLTAALVAGPAHGSVTLNADGSFVYTPQPNYRGTDSFTYTVGDGTYVSSSTATVTLSVGGAGIRTPRRISLPTGAPPPSPVPLASVVMLPGDSSTGLGAPSVAADARGVVSAPTNDSAQPRVSPDAAATDQPPVATDDTYTVAKSTARAVAPPGVLANDTDPDGNALTARLAFGTLHGFLTLNNDGSFVYTPVSGYLGTDSFTYQAFDGTLYSNTATVHLTVTGPDDPPTAGNNAYLVKRNTLFYESSPGVLVDDKDPNGQPLKAVLNTGPAHGALTLGSDGSFTYTPANNYVGPDSFTYTATDGQLSSNVATVSLYVDSPPVATAENFTINENQTLTLPAPGVLANDTDPDPGDTLTAVLEIVPSYGTLTLNGDGSLSYVPKHNVYGTDSFYYYVRDSHGAISSEVLDKITINHVNQPPVAGDDTYTVPFNGTLTAAGGQTYLTMQSDPGDYIGAGQTYNFNATSGTYRLLGNLGSASVAFNGGSESWQLDFTAPTGTDLVPGTYTNVARVATATQPGLNIIGDSRGSSTVTGQFTVNQIEYGVNGVLIAFAASFEQHSGGATPALRGQVAYHASSPGGGEGLLFNDIDADKDPLTAALATGPAHGVVNLNADGTFTYTPNVGYSGPDSFTYTATDGQLNSNVATARIMVLGPPVVADDTYRVMTGTACTVAAPGVLANDLDPQGSPLTAALVAGPAHGSVTLNADGSFVYTPQPNYRGTDSFTYTVGDGTYVSSSTATVTLSVGGAGIRTPQRGPLPTGAPTPPPVPPAPIVMAPGKSVAGLGSPTAGKDALRMAAPASPVAGVLALAYRPPVSVWFAPRASASRKGRVLDGEGAWFSP